MIRAEDWLRGEVRKAFKGRGAHLSWIEAPEVGAGFPDLDFMEDGVGTQIELKVTKANGDIKIRGTQYKWFKDRVRAGGRPFLWVYDHSRELHWAVRGEHVQKIEHSRHLLLDRDIYHPDPIILVHLIINNIK